MKLSRFCVRSTCVRCGARCAVNELSSLSSKPYEHTPARPNPPPSQSHPSRQCESSYLPPANETPLHASLCRHRYTITAPDPDNPDGTSPPSTACTAAARRTHGRDERTHAWVPYAAAAAGCEGRRASGSYGEVQHGTVGVDLRRSHIIWARRQLHDTLLHHRRPLRALLLRWQSHRSSADVSGCALLSRPRAAQGKEEVPRV